MHEDNTTTHTASSSGDDVGNNKRKHVSAVESGAAPPRKPAAAKRAWTPRAGHVKESVVAYFAPGSEALRLLLSVLRPSADATNTTSIRTLLWFVSNYASYHKVAYMLKGTMPPIRGSGGDPTPTPTPPPTAATAALPSPPPPPPPPPPQEECGEEDNDAKTGCGEQMNASSSSKRAPLPLQPSGSARASIPIGRGGIRPPFVVATTYQNARDSIGDKLLFDPNCRVSYNMEIPDGCGGTLATSAGQLNFFKWAIQKEVLQYVIEHRSSIALDQQKREIRKPAQRRDAGGDNKATAPASSVVHGGGGGAARKPRRSRKDTQPHRPMRAIVTSA